MRAEKTSRREFLRLAALTASGAALAACAPPAPAPARATPAQATEAAPAEPTTPPEAPTEAPPEVAPEPAAKAELTLWGWWDIRMKIYEDAAKDFMQSNPDVSIKVEVLPDDEIQQKVYSAVTAGTGPSMLKMGEFFFKMREQDLLLPFPEDAFPDSWFKETYPNVNWDAYGRHVIPTGTCGTVLVYNKKMFQEAGLDPEKPPVTWDDFVKAAQVTTQKDSNGAITRAGYVPGYWWPGMDQCYQVRGNIVTRKGDKQIATFDSPEMKQAMQWMSDLVFTHQVWDPAFPDNLESVGTGLAAMTQDESWVIGEYIGSYADIYPDLGYAAPCTPTGKPEPYHGHKSTVLDLSVLKGRPDEYAATFRFVEFLYKQGKETFWRLAKLINCAPERVDLFDDPRLKGSPGLSKVAEVLPTEYDPVQPPEELGPIWANVMNQIVVEQKPIDEALAYGQAELQKLLDQGLAKYLV